MIEASTFKRTGDEMQDFANYEQSGKRLMSLQLDACAAPDQTASLEHGELRIRVRIASNGAPMYAMGTNGAALKRCSKDSACVALARALAPSPAPATVTRVELMGGAAYMIGPGNRSLDVFLTDPDKPAECLRSEAQTYRQKAARILRMAERLEAGARWLELDARLSFEPRPVPVWRLDGDAVASAYWCDLPRGLQVRFHADGAGPSTLIRTQEDARAWVLARLMERA